MSVKYIPNGSVKIVIGGKTYQNIGEETAVLPVDKISDEELENLLKKKFIRKLDLNESGTSTPTGKPKNEKKKPETIEDIKTGREALLEKAKKAGITVTDDMADEEIQQLITEATKAQ